MRFKSEREKGAFVLHEKTRNFIDEISKKSISFGKN